MSGNCMFPEKFLVKAKSLHFAEMELYGLHEP